MTTQGKIPFYVSALWLPALLPGTVCVRVHACAVTVDLTHWFLGCAKSLTPTLWSSGITDVTVGTLCITTPLASSSFSFHVS